MPGLVQAITRENEPPEWATSMAALLSLACALIAVVGFGGVYSYVSTPVYIALYAGILVLALSSASLGFDLPWTPLLIPMLGFGTLVLAQYALRRTAYLGDTRTGLFGLAGCGAIFYLAFFGFRDAKRLRLLRMALFTATGVISAEAILQYFTANKYIYWFHNATYAWPMGPFVYYNHYAGCMDLLIPPAVSMMFTRGQPGDQPWLRRVRLGLVPLLAAGSVVLSASRGGVGTLAFEAVLAAAIFWPGWEQVRKQAAAWLSALVIAAAGLLAVPWRPILARLGGLGANDADLTNRIKVALACLLIFRNHLLSGAGFNTFAAVYPRYALFDNDLRWLYAHNEYAQLLAETGIVGAICAVAVAVIVFMSFWSCRRGREPMRRFRLALFIGLAGLMAHSLVDFQFHAPANALLFFLFAGAAVQPPPRWAPRRRARAHP